jgi:4'-phosphopantetheinyl transferase
MTVRRLAENDVHVRWATLSVPDEELGAMKTLLSPDEHRRAERYLIPSVRRRFVVGRAILRTLLGGYLGVEARDVELEYGPAGKPQLAARLASDLRFNLAHSRHLAAFAFCRNTHIGVDIEHVDPAIDTTAIVATMFSASERDRYLALPEAEKPRRFYLAWTRREAYLKGLGYGLTRSPAEVDVADAPGPRRFAVSGGGGATGWSVQDLAFEDRWIGALAVQRKDWQLTISR